MSDIKISKEYKVAIVGTGFVGKAYGKMFPDAILYDEPLGIGTREEVNKCDLALICVPTDLKHVPQSQKGLEGRTGFHRLPKNELDMSIVEEVVSWIDTPLILIKSALQPGTVDRLVKETDKNIAVSVEMVGEGKYNIPFWKYPHPTNPTKHQFLIVGGEDETARRCADFLWAKMSPDIDIQLTSAIEAEITKLMENTWGAMKVTFANTIYDICEEYGANYTKVLQAWGADGRVEKMHMRVIPHKRGWKSKCYDKDVPALGSLDKSGFINKLVEANQGHLNG
jgi:UDPglucose 6-dehydrogenase